MATMRSLKLKLTNFKSGESVPNNKDIQKINDKDVVLCYYIINLSCAMHIIAPKACCIWRSHYIH